MTTETMREAVELAIGYAMASAVSGNNMPHASGDPRVRIPAGLRRGFDRSVRGAADAAIRTVLERLRDSRLTVQMVFAVTDESRPPAPVLDNIWQAMLDAAAREVG